MFFTGTLQEGISTALQQSKLVACFVIDDQEESKTWETEYLTDERIAPSLEKEAVVLRLTAGSEEAGYLAAIFPLPKIPALVVIKNGALKEYIASGTDKDDFVRKVAGAFAGAQPQLRGQKGGNAENASPAVQAETSSAVAAAQPSTTSPTATNEATGMETTSTSSGQEATAPGTASPEHVSNEGERRRQAARKERERIEREKAQRRKEKGKMPAAEGGGGGDDKKGSEDPRKSKHNESVKKASQQLAEKQRQAREERARVLKLIADDKAERKAKEEMRKAEREAERSATLSKFAAATSTQQQQDSAAPRSPIQRRHDQCAIQVRLFDGSTIRTRLPSKATIAQDVRSWVDENRTDGKDPYTFKVILTPLTNRAIDHATEEDKTLQELELTPSSTLVLTPVDRYATAYTSMNAGLGSPVSRFVTAVLAFVVNILGGIAGALGGGGGAARGSDGRGEDAGHELSSSSSSSQAQTTGRDGGGRIQGFQNPDDRRKDYQLYNGNSVSATHGL